MVEYAHPVRETDHPRRQPRSAFEHAMWLDAQDTRSGGPRSYIVLVGSVATATATHTSEELTDFYSQVAEGVEKFLRNKGARVEVATLGKTSVRRAMAAHEFGNIVVAADGTIAGARAGRSSDGGAGGLITYEDFRAENEVKHSFIQLVNGTPENGTYVPFGLAAVGSLARVRAVPDFRFNPTDFVDPATNTPLSPLVVDESNEFTCPALQLPIWQEPPKENPLLRY